MKIDLRELLYLNVFFFERMMLIFKFHNILVKYLINPQI